jgi:hypothetical protein
LLSSFCLFLRLALIVHMTVAAIAFSAYLVHRTFVSPRLLSISFTFSAVLFLCVVIPTLSATTIAMEVVNKGKLLLFF